MVGLTGSLGGGGGVGGTGGADGASGIPRWSCGVETHLALFYIILKLSQTLTNSINVFLL